MSDTEEIKNLESKIDDIMCELMKQRSDWSVEIKDIRLSFSDFEARLDVHSDILNSILHWKNSNGSPGAEERLRKTTDKMAVMDKTNIPERLNTIEANVITLQRVADHAIMDNVQGAVNDTLDKRERTTIARLKAWGPIVSAALAAAAIVIAAVF